MGEKLINPIHNVHKKYRTMNLVNPYIFTPIVTYNTYIGGVSGTISTASALATKLAIPVGNISNFTVVGSDIKCKITGGYSISSSAFTNDSNITYYRDSGICTSFDSNTFGNAGNLMDIELPSVTSMTYVYGFIFNYKLERIYIPNCVSFGSTAGNNSIFEQGFPFKQGCIIYAHPSMATINSGGVEGDLQRAITAGGVVRYVSNYTSPSAVSTLASGTAYNTAIQLNFTPPSATNAIDFYEVYVNGVYNNSFVSSGGYAIGLSPAISYNIVIVTVDVLYNKSIASNSVSASTSSYSYTDVDANTYISAASLSGGAQESAYRLIVDLKTNSLYAKTQAIYPFKGTTAAQHKFNAKNPVDTNAGFRLIFSGTATHSNLGYAPNGTNGYANSFFAPNANQNVNSNGITVVVGTNNAAASSNVVEVGSYNSASQSSYLMVKNNNTNYKRRIAINSESPECSQSGTNEARGIFTGSRQSATVSDLFRNGVQIATSAAAGTLPALNIFIGALNAGSAVTFSNQRIQTVIFHEGLSDSEAATLHSIIDLSEAIAGRKTW